MSNASLGAKLPVFIYVVVSWWCPALPYPGGCSTIGAGGLSFRVRYGAGRGSPAMTTRTGLVGACPRAPTLGVVSWVRAPCSVLVCPASAGAHRCGADQRVWWGLVVDRIVDAHPRGGGPWHALACLTLALACADARSRVLVRVCLCVVSAC